MKKLLALASAASLAFSVSCAIPSLAAAGANVGANRGATAFCQMNAALYGLSEGQCIVLLTARPPDANQTCLNLRYLNPVTFFSHYPHFGDCVAALNMYLHS